MRRSIILLFLLIGLTSCSVFKPDTPPVYVVFFSSSSTELSTDGQKIVRDAAGAIRTTHPASVTVAAGALSGDNLKLAEPRFTAVQQALIADGVDASLIARAALADTNTNVGHVGDQRVEIQLVRKSVP